MHYTEQESTETLQLSSWPSLHWAKSTCMDGEGREVDSMATNSLSLSNCRTHQHACWSKGRLLRFSLLQVSCCQICTSRGPDVSGGSDTPDLMDANVKVWWSTEKEKCWRHNCIHTTVLMWMAGTVRRNVYLSSTGVVGVEPFIPGMTCVMKRQDSSSDEVVA